MKAQIAALKSFPVEGMKLIHSGAVLADTQALSGTALKEGDFLVCVVKKSVRADRPSLPRARPFDGLVACCVRWRRHVAMPRVLALAHLVAYCVGVVAAAVPCLARVAGGVVAMVSCPMGPFVCADGACEAGGRPCARARACPRPRHARRRPPPRPHTRTRPYVVFVACVVCACLCVLCVPVRLCLCVCVCSCAVMCLCGCACAIVYDGVFVSVIVCAPSFPSPPTCSRPRCARGVGGVPCDAGGHGVPGG